MITKITTENAIKYNALFDDIANILTELLPYKDTSVDNNGISTDNYFFSKEEAEKWLDIFKAIDESNAGDMYYVYGTDPDSGDEIITKVEISSLETYYGIIANLFKIKPQYGLLPLDEPYFEINANTRSIQPPPNFSVQVAGDESAETIYFRINRYFDMKDLFSQSIIIQWENAKGIKGYSTPSVVMIDEEAEDDFIIFGWTLTSGVGDNGGFASAPGYANFSVRFYSFKDSEDTSAGSDTKKEIAYSLNTLSSSLQIRPGLQVDLTASSTVKEENMASVMEDRITNGLLSGVPTPPPPTIVDTNIDETKKYFIDYSNNNSDSVIIDGVSYKCSELQVMAFTPSAGNLSAAWYKRDSSGKGLACTDIRQQGQKIISVKFNKDDPNLAQKIKENIYYLDAECVKKPLLEINDEIKYEENGDFTAYTKVFYFKVIGEGTYYCSVINHKGLQKKSTATGNAYFPSSTTPTVQSIPHKEGYVSEKIGDEEKFVYLQANPKNEDTDSPNTFTYQWQYKKSSTDSFNNLSGKTGQILQLQNSSTDPQIGEYQCLICHTANGTISEPAIEKWIVSTAPTLNLICDQNLKMGENSVSKENILASGNYILEILEDTEVTFTLTNFSEYNLVSYSCSGGELVQETQLKDSNSFTIKVTRGATYNITCKGVFGENFKSKDTKQIIIETKLATS